MVGFPGDLYIPLLLAYNCQALHYKLFLSPLSHTPFIETPKASDLPPPPPKLKSLWGKVRGGLDL
jgi:hypothetical protein